MNINTRLESLEKKVLTQYNTPILSTEELADWIYSNYKKIQRGQTIPDETRKIVEDFMTKLK